MGYNSFISHLDLPAAKFYVKHLNGWGGGGGHYGHISMIFPKLLCMYNFPDHDGKFTSATSQMLLNSVCDLVMFVYSTRHFGR